MTVVIVDRNILVKTAGLNWGLVIIAQPCCLVLFEQESMAAYVLGVVKSTSYQQCSQVVQPFILFEFKQLKIDHLSLIFR